MNKLFGKLSTTVPVYMIFLSALAFGLLGSALTAFRMEAVWNDRQYRLTGELCLLLEARLPEAGTVIPSVLKELGSGNADASSASISLHPGPGIQYLDSLGFHPSFFRQKPLFPAAIPAAVCGALLLTAVLILMKQAEKHRIRKLTTYLEKVNTGGGGLLFSTSESAYSRLQDELYKTVTSLHQTRDAALKARQNYADNLANIAHQLKTPVTSLSLSAQILQENLHNTPSAPYPERIQRQLTQLVRLQEALLLLARIDAGVLALSPASVDVFTLLTLAADQLQELFALRHVQADIPELDAVTVTADPDWTLEAVLNLMKNCLEHAPEGSAVHCTYEQNSLYTCIRIRDEGKGFADRDLPHLFERFYRGSASAGGGIGIGLSIAKEVIERQNGVLTAFNLPGAGACFEIRLYRH